MAKANPFGPGLDVAGQISVLVDDIPCAIEFQGDVVLVKVDDLRAVRALRVKLGHEIARIPQFDGLLRQASLRLEIEVAGRRVGQLGHGIQPNWVGRALGLGLFRIEPTDLWGVLIGNLRRKEVSR